MTGALRLGARLALGNAGQRGRSLLVAGAAALGVLLLLAVLAVAAAEQAKGSDAFSATELRRLTAVVIAVVALPIVVLAATVGRLSASIRDRRLANLRLLGLTPLQTRTVAAAEAGLSAFAGVAAGAVAFIVLRPLLASLSVADLSWSASALRPGPAGWLLALIGIPAVTVAVASVPHRYDARATLDRARRRDARRPSMMRLLPLTAGLVVSVMAWGTFADHVMTWIHVALAFIGIGLTGIGVVIVVPVFVRLLADLLHRFSRGPATLIAARRLQAQPAGVARVIAALMIGLFLVMGARCVVVAFERTPHYESAARSIDVQQRAVLQASAARAAKVAERARQVAGVRTVTSYPALMGNRGDRLRRSELGYESAVVASCADLERIEPRLRGCVDGEVLANGEYLGGQGPTDKTPIVLTAQRGVRDPLPHQATIHLPAPKKALHVAGSATQPLNPISFTLVVPPDYPGLAAVTAQAPRQIAVTAGPGRDLTDRLLAAGLPVASWYDFETYDFVVALRTIVWTVAAVILGVGLLTFAIAAIDRALTRRRELASLQVLGTSPTLLRRSQWLEAALPTTTGSLLAIAAGFFAGSTYLRLDGSTLGGFPWRPGLALAVLALAASMIIAALTVVATNNRLSPEQIRAE